MLNFKLLPGDKYEGRCAEIYITEKQFLIYHCSVCDEIYATFNELVCHITKDHYENTREYSKMEARSVETVITQQNDNKNQLATKEVFVVKTKNSTNFDKNLVVENNRGKGKNEPYFSDHLLETLNEITEIKFPSETGKMLPLLNSSKSFVQLHKLRSMARVIEKANINTLTRCQVISSEDQKYVCDICGFAFKEKYNLRRHLLRHSNKKITTCSLCPKKFFTNVELRLHEYRHKGERLYFCDHCGMGFIRSGSLIQHIRKLHNIQRSFKCGQYYKTFSKLYHCTECLLTFKYKEAINNNSKLHNNVQKILNCDSELSNAVTFNNNQKQEGNFVDQSGKEFERYFIKDTIEYDSHKHVKRDNLREKAIENYFDLEPNTHVHESKG